MLSLDDKAVIAILKGPVPPTVLTSFVQMWQFKMEFRLPSNKVLCIWRKKLHDSKDSVERGRLKQACRKMGLHILASSRKIWASDWKSAWKKSCSSSDSTAASTGGNMGGMWGQAVTYWLIRELGGKKGNLGVCKQIFVPFFCLLFNFKVKKKDSIWKNYSLLHYNKALIWYQEEGQHILLYTDDVITIWFC